MTQADIHADDAPVWKDREKGSAMKSKTKVKVISILALVGVVCFADSLPVSRSSVLTQAPAIAVLRPLATSKRAVGQLADV